MAHCSGHSVAEASMLLCGFTGGSTGFTAMGVLLPAAQCQPLEAMVATTISNCGCCTSKVGGAQLCETSLVGSGLFSLSVQVAEATVSMAIRTLNSTSKPEAGTALAALLAEGSQLRFTGNPLLHLACFAKVSTSYWGAVASWLAVYQWTIALPCWVPSWTGCPTSDVLFDLVWAAAADGQLRCVV